MREQIGHLERAPHGLGALADPGLGLLDPIQCQNAERHRDARLQSGELETARGLARDLDEVRRVASNDAPERHDARKPPSLRERRRGQR